MFLLLNTKLLVFALYLPIFLMNVWLVQIKILFRKSILIYKNLEESCVLVEPRRIELLTPCVQGRCSPS